MKAVLFLCLVAITAIAGTAPAGTFGTTTDGTSLVRYHDTTARDPSSLFVLLLGPDGQLTRVDRDDEYDEERTEPHDEAGDHPTTWHERWTAHLGGPIVSTEIHPAPNAAALPSGSPGRAGRDELPLLTEREQRFVRPFVVDGSQLLSVRSDGSLQNFTEISALLRVPLMYVDDVRIVSTTSIQQFELNAATGDRRTAARSTHTSRHEQQQVWLDVARFNTHIQVEHRRGLFHWNMTISKFHVKVDRRHTWVGKQHPTMSQQGVVEAAGTDAASRSEKEEEQRHTRFASRRWADGSVATSIGPEASFVSRRSQKPSRMTLHEIERKGTFDDMEEGEERDRQQGQEEEHENDEEEGQEEARTSSSSLCLRGQLTDHWERLQTVVGFLINPFAAQGNVIILSKQDTFGSSSSSSPSHSSSPPSSLANVDHERRPFWDSLLQSRSDDPLEHPPFVVRAELQQSHQQCHDAVLYVPSDESSTTTTTTAAATEAALPTDPYAGGPTAAGSSINPFLVMPSSGAPNRNYGGHFAPYAAHHHSQHHHHPKPSQNHHYHPSHPGAATELMYPSHPYHDAATTVSQSSVPSLSTTTDGGFSGFLDQQFRWSVSHYKLFVGLQIVLWIISAWLFGSGIFMRGRLVRAHTKIEKHLQERHSHITEATAAITTCGTCPSCPPSSSSTFRPKSVPLETVSPMILPTPLSSSLSVPPLFPKDVVMPPPSTAQQQEEPLQQDRDEQEAEVREKVNAATSGVSRPESDVEQLDESREPSQTINECFAQDAAPSSPSCSSSSSSSASSDDWWRKGKRNAKPVRMPTRKEPQHEENDGIDEDGSASRKSSSDAEGDALDRRSNEVDEDDVVSPSERGEDISRVSIEEEDSLLASNRLDDELNATREGDPQDVNNEDEEDGEDDDDKASSSSSSSSSSDSDADSDAWWKGRADSRKGSSQAFQEIPATTSSSTATAVVAAAAAPAGRKGPHVPKRPTPRRALLGGDEDQKERNGRDEEEELEETGMGRREGSDELPAYTTTVPTASSSHGKLPPLDPHSLGAMISRRAATPSSPSHVATTTTAAAATSKRGSAPPSPEARPRKGAPAAAQYYYSSYDSHTDDGGGGDALELSGGSDEGPSSSSPSKRSSATRRPMSNRTVPPPSPPAVVVTTPPAPTAALATAPQLFQQHFRILERIGLGGSGMVFSVEHRVTKVQYAIKLVALLDGDDERSVREATLHSQFDDPHVVRFFYCWIEELAPQVVEQLGIFELLDGPSFGDTVNSMDEEEEEEDRTSSTYQGCTGTTTDRSFLGHVNENGCFRLLFIQMEYFPNGTLGDRLQQRMEVDRAENIDHLLQIAKGLDYLHTQGVIHRDIKPTNIFVTGKNSLKIGDFGLAKKQPGMMGSGARGSLAHNRSVEELLPIGAAALGEETTAAGCSPLYSSPEQRDARHITAASDVYSLGVLAVEMYSSFGETNSERIHTLLAVRDGVLPRHFFEKYPEEVDMIRSMTRRLPTARPSMSDVIQTLKAIQRAIRSPKLAHTATNGVRNRTPPPRPPLELHPLAPSLLPESSTSPSREEGSEKVHGGDDEEGAETAVLTEVSPVTALLDDHALSDAWISSGPSFCSNPTEAGVAQ